MSLSDEEILNLYNAGELTLEAVKDLLPEDPDLLALKAFYASAITKYDLKQRADDGSLTASTVYDLSRVPRELWPALKKDIQKAVGRKMQPEPMDPRWMEHVQYMRGLMEQLPVDTIHLWPPKKIDPVPDMVAWFKDNPPILVDILIDTSGHSPWIPGTTSTSTPASKAPSSSSTNSESSEVEPGPKHS
jgi:hypothetical protein